MLRYSTWVVAGMVGLSAAGGEELLVDSAGLAAMIAEGDIVVLDARSGSTFELGHVPGAVQMDPGRWKGLSFQKGARGDAALWSRHIGALGIDNAKPVVVYDDGSSLDASRMWFLLRCWSVKDLRILNGGFKAWKTTGNQVETERRPVDPVAFNAVRLDGAIVEKAEICAALPSKGMQVLDVRSQEEYDGTVKRAKRNGHIPGAVHLEWKQAVDATGRFKSVEALKALFAGAGLTHDKPIVTHCLSGGRASHTYFALMLAGYDNIQNYYDSWQDWGNDPDVPIE